MTRICVFLFLPNDGLKGEPQIVTFAVSYHCATKISVCRLKQSFVWRAVIHVGGGEALISFVASVGPSVCIYQLGSHWTDFRDAGDLSETLQRKWQ